MRYVALLSYVAALLACFALAAALLMHVPDRKRPTPQEICEGGGGRWERNVGAFACVEQLVEAQG